MHRALDIPPRGTRRDRSYRRERASHDRASHDRASHDRASQDRASQDRARRAAGAA